MGWHSVQTGTKKAKKRVQKRWFKLFDPDGGGFIFNDEAQKAYEICLKMNRKTTIIFSKDRYDWKYDCTPAVRREMMKYELKY